MSKNTSQFSSLEEYICNQCFAKYEFIYSGTKWQNKWNRGGVSQSTEQKKNKGEMGIKLWENSPRTLTFRTQNTASEKCKQSSCKEESLRIGSAIWEPTVLNACVILKSKSTSKSSRWRMWGSKPVKYRPEFRFLFALIVAAYLQPRSTGLNLSK